DPINLSAMPFCQGEPGAMGLSRMPIVLSRRVAAAPWPSYWDRRRLADSRLRLDPGAGRCFGPERTGEQMLGAAHRHTDAKKWRVVVCARPLKQDERDELVYRRVPRHNRTFGRSGQIKSQRSCMLCASRREQSPLSCSFHFIMFALRPYFSISLRTL